MHLEKITLCQSKFPTRDCYPFNLEILNNTKDVTFNTPVTFLVGENGSGKSTLLKAICRSCGIHIWEMEGRQRFEQNPYEEHLFRAIDIHWKNGPVPGSIFCSRTFRNFAQLLDEWAADDPGILNYFGGKSLMTLSHGQSLMSYFSSRYSIKGIYFLDEPETALSPKSQLQLLKILEKAGKSQKAQFIIATHSPILMSCSGARIISFDFKSLKEIEYEDTDHYKVYRDFMASLK
jgi:predicted ATPase